MFHNVPRSAALVITSLALVACQGGGPTASPSTPTNASLSPPAAAVLWPAPPDPLDRTVAAGLEPGQQEHRANHVHAHLDVFVDGQPITVPAGIGINIDDPDVGTFDEPDGSVSYGGIEVCAKPCISPLHTHYASGIIHTESATPEPNRLGEFFIEWGVTLSDSCVGEYCSPKPIAFYVDGEPYAQDPREIELTDHKEIAIVIGSPPPQIPSTADFSKE
jgi:hypothetical protein